MARIKIVLNERRLAYEGAVQLVEQERGEPDPQSMKILRYLELARDTERNRSSRRARQARKKIAVSEKSTEDHEVDNISGVEIPHETVREPA